jgi:hypothetical protein
MAKEGGRHGARAGALVVDLPWGWEHLLSDDVGLTGNS